MFSNENNSSNETIEKMFEIKLKYNAHYVRKIDKLKIQLYFITT